MAVADNAKSVPSPDSPASGPGDTDLPSSVPLAANSEDRDSSSHGPEDPMSPSKSRDRDPSKPKRKKARRACAACQRAHLTCSDERPCERCIKRNLADQCQDGTRKKAKYLHDAPNEALMPGHAAKYKHENGTMVPAEHSQHINGNAQAFSGQTISQQNGLPMPAMREEFKQQYSPASSAFESQQPSPLHQVPPRLQHSNSSPQTMSQQAAQQAFGPQYLDSSDPAGVFNFDMSSMNFGNHHGALEFGMLGNMGQLGQSPQFGYDQTQGYPDNRTEYSMGSDSTWGNKHLSMSAFDPTMTSSMEWRRNSQNAFPHAFAIGTGSNGFAGQSPASSIEMWQNEFATPADNQMSAVRSQPHQVRPQATPPSAQGSQSKTQPARKSGTPSVDSNSQSNGAVNGLNEPNQSISKKLGGTLKTHPAFARRRQRDPSFIYKSINVPYPYTQAFHALTAVILRRFPARKRVRIAKALASIRPSFISLNRNLTDPDLVFMEQNFQRCIWDYEEDSNSCGTPTLIIRRTGEVAYADKEFTLLSGWPKEILYGRSPNKNTNKAAQDANPAGTGSGANTVNSSRGGYNTPRINAVDGFTQNEEASAAVSAEVQQYQQQSSGKPRVQPVFLAELLDDDSVVDFYEEYSQRAFGDSRGTTSRRCKLLKYKPPSADSDMQSDSKTINGHTNGEIKRRGSHPDERALVSNVNGDLRRTRPGISSEEGMKRLGDEKGAVDCMYCWMVKQDCFNIPMLIVINFLPIL